MAGWNFSCITPRRLPQKLLSCYYTRTTGWNCTTNVTARFCEVAHSCHFLMWFYMTKNCKTLIHWVLTQIYIINQVTWGPQIHLSHQHDASNSVSLLYNIQFLTKLLHTSFTRAVPLALRNWKPAVYTYHGHNCHKKAIKPLTLHMFTAQRNLTTNFTLQML